MESLTPGAWREALKLYRWVCTFVAVARREHDDWWLDVGAIMRRETRDPRGWESLDPYEDEEERREDPLFPWLETPSTPADAERYRPMTSEVPRSSVPSLLVMFTVSPLSDPSRLPDWEKYGPERERRAKTLLSRFPDGTRFFSNLGCWEGDRPDFLKQSSLGSNPFSGFDWDAGLIAVNNDEVAVIWNFFN
ncbi:hypothetical protein ACFVQ4_14590 [Streptomyces laurentii]|uniref:hypothetical protein n=1 Tax=Streptomyces laurentii TaxID=39478 RepID=UPI0036A1E037